jgi:hypothetical protein
VTTIAPPETQRRLAELEQRTRSAWASYQEQVRDLDGRVYEDAEAASWERLQATLGEVAAERARLPPTG